MKLLLTFFMAGMAVVGSFAQEKNPITIGETVEIFSQTLSEKRKLNIYLPPDFSKDKNLPVIYLLDGSLHEDFVHITGLVQFFNLMFSMPPTIIVGIENVDRKRDFTFPTQQTAQKEKFPTTGGSEKFIGFLADELIPFITKNYSENTDITLIGQSLGGLLATEVLLKRPVLFKNYFIISPSLWWNNESLLKEFKKFPIANTESEINIGIAVGAEGNIMVREAKGLHTALTKLGRNNIKSAYIYLPKENHATVLHQAMYMILERKFPSPHK